MPAKSSPVSSQFCADNADVANAATLKSKIIFVERHAMVRQGMAMLINAERDMEVIAEAGNYEDAMACLESVQHPDALLVSLSLRNYSGLSLIKSVHDLIPSLPVLVVSMHDELVYAERALQANARGYIMKKQPGSELIHALREVLKGNVYLSAAMRSKLSSRTKTGVFGFEPLINRLSPAEFEVLHLIATGHDTQEISQMLQRSVKTIETHRNSIRIKLELKNGADLIRYATRWILSEHWSATLDPKIIHAYRMRRNRVMMPEASRASL